MKSGEKLNINVYTKVYLFLKITDKLRITIRYNEIRNIIFSIEFYKSGMIYTDSINFLHKHKYSIFKKAVHNNHHIDADFLMSIDE